jgi:coproporphyrinogen III oxidase-like Fe-S oxidoreductase
MRFRIMQEGFESIHNLAYWNYDEYLGIGPALILELLLIIK